MGSVLWQTSKHIKQRYFRCVIHFKFPSWSKQYTHSQQVPRKKTTVHSEKKNNFTHLRFEQSGPNHSGSCVSPDCRPTVQEESHTQPYTLSSSHVLESYLYMNIMSEDGSDWDGTQKKQQAQKEIKKSISLWILFIKFTIEVVYVYLCCLNLPHLLRRKCWAQGAGQNSFVQAASYSYTRRVRSNHSDTCFADKPFR